MAQTDFTIADVLEWARTKPADERYDYSDPFNCALCHFLRDTGRAKRPLVCPQSGFPISAGWWERGDSAKARAYPRELEPALKAETFGGLVARLEKLCPETPVTKSDWARLDAYMADIELASA